MKRGIIDELMDTQRPDEHSNDDEETQSLTSDGYSEDTVESTTIQENPKEYQEHQVSIENTDDNPKENENIAVKEISHDDLKGMSVQDIAVLCEKVLSEESIKRFKDEEINGPAFLSILALPLDSRLFQKLGMTIGRTVKLKETFQGILAKPSISKKEKPRRQQLKSLTPRTKTMYSMKRKRIGTEAFKYWEGKLPMFNTPKRREELRNFAESVVPDCGFEKTGFGVDGIMEHTKEYFTEQRRYLNKKSKQSVISAATANVSSVISTLSITSPTLTADASSSMITRPKQSVQPSGAITSQAITTSPITPPTLTADVSASTIVTPRLRTASNASATLLDMTGSSLSETSSISGTLSPLELINFEVAGEQSEKRKSNNNEQAMVPPIVLKKLPLPVSTSTQKESGKPEDALVKKIRKRYNISRRRYERMSSLQKDNLTKKYNESLQLN